MAPNLRVLLVIEQCNPEWPSVPLEGFRYYEAVRELADVTLVTHERNRAALTRSCAGAEVVFIPESRTISRYYRLVDRIAVRGGRVNWPLLYALGYPIYAEFNRRVFRRFSDSVAQGKFDVVHAFSPILPRYPVKLVKACRGTPFLLGPVNGGLPFPPAFGEIALKEFDRFNTLRVFSRAIPGYRATYRQASRILAGSSATEEMLRRLFAIHDDRIELFHENGVAKSRFAPRTPQTPGDPVQLLFAGRLVPFKCADIVIDALGRTAPDLRVALTILGDGPERRSLEERARRLNLADRVSFAGWIPHEQTAEYFQRAGIFCFPSIREFGGAVVLEAMAAGLACIVTDYGGIAEYVTDDCGYRIAPRSREYLVCEMARRIEDLARSEELRDRMSAAAVKRAAGFEWGRKGRRLIEIYANLLERTVTGSESLA
ncbi:MAG TPA: glycosyltransferase family 4 protein [Bryobacteraceae bacterium]|nr:glycosyltransferase family 4 protein [Bryobacteraceae bacterium]